MGYRLRLDEPVAKGIGRIAKEQFATAERSLIEAPDLEVAVHSARKTIKRLRSLLHLVRPGLSKATFKRENRRLRAIAQAMSGRRDADVLQATLARLVAGASVSAKVADKLPRLNAILEERRVELGKCDDLSPVVQSLGQARDKFRKSLSGVDSIEVLAQGAAHVYGACQSNYGIAMVSPTVDHIHELRKDVQRHWRHMQVLSPLWPGLLKARVQLAREISDLLGADHDLALAMDFIEICGEVLRSDHAQRRLLEVASERQFEIRQRAFARTEVLLSGDAGEWARVLPKYWRAAQRMNKEDVEVVF